MQQGRSKGEQPTQTAKNRAFNPCSTFPPATQHLIVTPQYRQAYG
jgi:hypothetical protein